jgi:uncharacterized membrane protein YccC
MPFQPSRQINAILAQENFEPTISWSLRVAFALNVPLLVLPVFTGFSAEVIWAAFGAYLLSLIDYRGLHSKKIVIQCLAALFIFMSGMLGMFVSQWLWMSVAAMFLLGIFVAIVRNWRDYGASIGVSGGFFFLYGLAYPLPLEGALSCGVYLLGGCAWAVFITLLTFRLRPSNPVKRSIAKIWSANTALLDAIAGGKPGDVIKSEMEVRRLINHSLDLFHRPEKGNGAPAHYDILMDLRKNAALFSATLSAMHAEVDVLSKPPFDSVPDASLQKTISSFAQASARMAIVIFTSRHEDLTIATVRVKRCAVALEVFNEATAGLQLSDRQAQALIHFRSTMEQALHYLRQSAALMESKLSIGKSDRRESYRLSMHSFAVGLNRQTIGNLVKSVQLPGPEQIKYALRVAVTLAAGVFIFKFFNIDHGYWIPLTLLIVIQPYYGATRKKGMERSVGTIAGTIVGGVIMLLPLPHMVFMVMLVVVSFLVAFYLRNNYKIGVFFTTLMMVILLQMSQQARWELIGWRVISTLIGALLAFGASYIFWPVWEKERLPVLLAQSLRGIKAYLHQVSLYYNGRLAGSESWYSGRRTAEAANNALFSSVQRMYEEPRHAQSQVDDCFAMVGMVIRITRELTSMAMIAQHYKKRMSCNALNNFSHQAGLLMEQLSARAVAGINSEQPDFTGARRCLSEPDFQQDEPARLILLEAEKIIFELEALSRMEVSLS